QTLHAVEETDVELDRNQVPIVPVNQRELGEQQPIEVGRAGLEMPEVNARVLELEQTIRRHSRVANLCGEHRTRRENLARPGGARGAGSDVEVVPIELPVRVLPNVERYVPVRNAARHGKGVFLAVRRP